MGLLLRVVLHLVGVVVLSKVGNAKKAIETLQYNPVETKFIKTFDNDGVDAAIRFLETGRFEQLIGNKKIYQGN